MIIKIILFYRQIFVFLLIWFDFIHTSIDSDIPKVSLKMEDNLEVKLEQLRLQLNKEGITPILDDSEYLIKFLYTRFLDINQTVDLIKSYTDYKAANPNIFSLPFRLKPVFDKNLMRLLNTRSKSDEALTLARPGVWDPNVFTFDQLLSASLISMEMAALDSISQKNGLIIIIDMDSFGWKQLLHFTPFQAAKLATLLDKVAPIKVNFIHIYNQSKWTNLAWAVIKPFLSEYAKKRITFHGKDCKHLEGYVKDFKSLPKSLGGEDDKFDCSDFYLNLANNESIFKSFGYT